MIIEKIEELKVLVNVFYAFKFGIDEELSDEIIRSPVFNRMFSKSVNEMINAYGSINTIDGSKASISDWYLSKRVEEREKVMEHLMKIENWEDTSGHVRSIIVRNLLSPMVFDNNDVKDILTEFEKRIK
jgi:hypothetical protein